MLVFKFNRDMPGQSELHKWRVRAGHACCKLCLQF